MEPKVITPDTSIVVGDRVQSHDFPDRLIYGDREPCYVEGVVIDIDDSPEGFRRYAIRVEKRVWAGVEEAVEPGTMVYTPVNGTATVFGNETFGVLKISK